MGKVHHRVELHVGAFGFKHLQKSDEHSVYAVNRVSALFEGENQFVRIAHRAGYYYARSIFLYQIVLLQICLVVLDAFEENVFVVGMFDVGVREHSGWRWSGGVDVSAEDDFLVNICADVVEHRAIVLSACSAQISVDGVGCYAVYAYDVVVGICSHRCEDVRSRPASHLNLVALFLGKSNAHGVYEYHVVVVNVVEFVERQFFNLDKRIVVSLAYLAKRCNLIVYEGDASASEPCVPYGC